MRKKHTFVKLNRTEATEYLLENHPNAFLLLTQIALRARREPEYLLGLDTCEAVIGDYKKIGLSHRQYRTAIDVLMNDKLIVKHSTNKGTVVKLICSDIYDINVIEGDKQTTNKKSHERQTNDKQEVIPETTNKKLRIKEDNNEKETPSSTDLRSDNQNEPKIKNCPQNEIVKLWNTTMFECPQIRSWASQAKRRNLATRWKEDKQRQDLSWWEDFFLYIRQSDFLMCRGKTDFIVSFDWLVKASNIQKVINGNYENREINQEATQIANACADFVNNYQPKEKANELDG